MGFDSLDGYGESKRVVSPAVLIGLIGLVVALVVGGVVVSHRASVRFKARLEVAKHDDAERVWLRTTAAQLVPLGQSIDNAEKQRIAVLEQGTKYKRIKGEKVAQPLSAQDQEHYDLINDAIAQMTQEYNEQAAAYNSRRAAYRGPWPDGPPAPGTFPLR